MSPLEHQYRRLLRLLPEDHRAARGEELLGLLLDFDEGRNRPSTRQVLGVIGLAIRLRLGELPTAVTFVFSAFLVAYGAMPIGQLIDDYTGAFLAADLPGLRHATPMLLAPALAQFAVTVIWILGGRRTALVVQAGCFAWESVDLAAAFRSGTADAGLILAIVAPLSVLAILALAARQRWTTPRPRLLWLAALVLAMIAWKVIGVWGRAGMYYPVLPPGIGWALAVLTAAIAVIFMRRRRWPAISAAALVGVGVGRLLPSLILQLVYGRPGWLTSITLGTVVLIGTGKLITHRLSDRPVQPRPPAGRHHD